MSDVNAIGMGFRFLAGVLASLVVACFTHWKWKPRVKVIGFRAVGYGGGTLDKLVFEVRGRTSPGGCISRFAGTPRATAPTAR